MIVTDLFQGQSTSARLRAQQQGSVNADDLLKFIVSTHLIPGIQSLELLDLWHVMEHGVPREDEDFGVQMQKNLVEEKSKGSEQLAGEKPMIKWTCRSIIVRTVFDGN